MTDLLTSSYNADRYRRADIAFIRRVREAERRGDVGELERLRDVNEWREWAYICCSRALGRLRAK